MAKVRNNIFVRGLSGSLGQQFIVRQDKAGRTIISNQPSFPQDRTFSEAQLEWQERFREATQYAKVSKMQEVYVEMAKGTHLSAYNVAVADWFRAPEIRDVQLNGWEGQAGQTIRIRAVDNVQVAQVNVDVMNSGGSLLERGAAVQGEDGWWVYTTVENLTDASQILVTASDLAGNMTEQVVE